mmetsp:Transcript_71630/g.207421  ORF Transcript_71630/g.207421 Transcript_71630/m.207421 type:complete len:307 (+) Transcript_71630:3879-4799(+)
MQHAPLPRQGLVGQAPVLPPDRSLLDVVLLLLALRRRGESPGERPENDRDGHCRPRGGNAEGGMSTTERRPDGDGVGRPLHEARHVVAGAKGRVLSSLTRIQGRRKAQSVKNVELQPRHSGEGHRADEPVRRGHQRGTADAGGHVGSCSPTRGRANRYRRRLPGGHRGSSCDVHPSDLGQRPGNSAQRRSARWRQAGPTVQVLRRLQDLGGPRRPHGGLRSQGVGGSGARGGRVLELCAGRIVHFADAAHVDGGGCAAVAHGRRGRRQCDEGPAAADGSSSRGVLHKGYAGLPLRPGVARNLSGTP